MAKPVSIRLSVPELTSGQGATPASLSGAISTSGTFQQGQTPTITWASVIDGVPADTVETTYTILQTTDGGATFSNYKSGSTAQTFDELAAADVGKQFLLRQTVHNAGTVADEIPQVSSSLTPAVAPLAVAPPAFTSGPTLSGTAANGNTLTISYTASGASPITPAYRWYINDALIVGETGATWVGLGLTGGDVVRAEVSLTNAGGSVAYTTTNTLTVAGSAIAQTAEFGSLNAAGTGGWRPRLASGAVEDLASYDNLVSGSLGAFTPSISSPPHATPGRLIFSGGTGAPNGAVLQCTGVSGRVYNVTIQQTTGTYAISSEADITAAGTSISANAGRRLLIRQNAQIPPRDSNWLNSGSSAASQIGWVTPITIEGEGYDGKLGSIIHGEYHLTYVAAAFPWTTTFRDLQFKNDPSQPTGIFYKSSTSRPCLGLSVERCYFPVDFNIDNADPTGPIADWTNGFPTTGYSKKQGVFGTDSSTDRVRIVDCIFDGGWFMKEVLARENLWHVGNRHYRPYSDFDRLLIGNGSTQSKCIISGANAYWVVQGYSVNETYPAEPHLDANQLTDGGQYTYTSIADAYMVWEGVAIKGGLQWNFQTYRPSTRIGGICWDWRGYVGIGRTPYAFYSGFPESMNVQYCAAIPGIQYETRLPVGSQSEGGMNVFVLGTVPAYDGGIGTHRIGNNLLRTTASLQGTIVQPADIDETGNVYFNGWNETDMTDNFALWPFSNVAPECSAQEIWAMSEAVDGSEYDAVSPFDHITIPGDDDYLSNYTISTTLRPNVVLSNLAVTNAATAAFTVDTDYDGASYVFWAVFSSALTGSTDSEKFEQIYWARNGASMPYTPANARGLAHRIGSPGTITGGGTASLAAGTYYLYVAQCNGPKRLTIASLAFTV